MTITYTKDKTDFKLSNDDAKKLKDNIVKMYSDYWKDLAPHVSDYEKIKRHVFGILREDDKDEYLSSKIYELRKTYISHLVNRCAGSVETLFGIEGNTKEDQDNSVIMKAFIEDKLERMGYLAEYDTLIPSYVDKGGAYTFTEWVTKAKEVKRIVKWDTSTNAEATPESLPGNIINKRISKTITEYDGAKARNIDPFSIVYNKDKVNDWDKCEKIVKEWLTPESILAIKEFEISNETREKLLKIAKGSSSSDTFENAEKIADEAIDNDRVEVLNFWGDLRLPDGTYLENWHCVVVGRMEVVRFCKNPTLENPITRCVFEVHPETGREYSPILVGIINNDKKSEVFRKVLKALDLSINPHLFTKGDMLNDSVEVKPGGITKIKPDLDEGNPIVYSIDGKGAPINLEVMPQFDADIEASTGINKYLTGNIEGSKVDFATEASGIMNGGEVRIQKDVDNINRNLTRDTIQKIANLHANMIDSDATIKTRNNGKIEFQQVTPEVIQGNYEFKVADAKQQTLNKEKAKTTVEILREIAQGNPNANTDEISKYALENICDIKDTSKFFIEDELQKAINAIPEEQREQAKGFLSQVLQNPQIMQQSRPMPNAEQIKNTLATYVIGKASLPDDFKMLLDQLLGLDGALINAPTSEAA